ncbi:MAG: hypothetical protein IME96_05875 [Proteobacteria bacterium]|nr:hypothetical protein [Pseudomonadota bacterium]
MPINDCPFTLCAGGVYRPILPIRIVNPHTGLTHSTFGLIDTGADECAIPAAIAPILGHDLQSGETKTVNTGNGQTLAYAHTTSFEVYHPETVKLLYTLPDTPIDFMPNLNVVLLGVRSFLSRFNLNINYPKRIFSITYPTDKT